MNVCDICTTPERVPLVQDHAEHTQCMYEARMCPAVPVQDVQSEMQEVTVSVPSQVARVCGDRGSGDITASPHRVMKSTSVQEDYAKQRMSDAMSLRMHERDERSTKPDKCLTDMIGRLSVGDVCEVKRYEGEQRPRCMTHRQKARRTQTRTKAWVMQSDRTYIQREVIELTWGCDNQSRMMESLNLYTSVGRKQQQGEKAIPGFGLKRKRAPAT